MDRKEVIEGFMRSNILTSKLRRNPSWDSQENSEVFTNEFLIQSSIKTYRTYFLKLSKMKRYIKKVTGKNMFKSYRHNKKGLHFSDIKKLISGKDNTHIHEFLDDKKCGNLISTILLRWIRYINFNEITTTPRVPTCIAITTKGEVCERFCNSKFPFCGYHTNWITIPNKSWLGKQ